MKIESNFFRLPVVALLCTVALLPARSVAAATSLVTWQQVLVRSEDPGPRLTVDDGGRVSAHVPAFLRGSGDFVFELEATELEQLRRDVARLAGLDLADLRAARRAQLRDAASSGAVPTQVGSVVSTFHLRGVGEIAWKGLAFDAAHFTDWRLQLLADLELRFEGWLRDTRRRSAEGTP